MYAYSANLVDLLFEIQTHTLLEASNLYLATYCHRLYTALDDLLDIFGVYKVETIGGEHL